MNAPLRTPLKHDIRALADAMAHNAASDCFSPNLTPAQWDVLGSYLQPFSLVQGQVLIEQNATDRTIYLVESGSLSVHYEDSKGRVRLAIVAAGSVVGEGAFFTRLPRAATVHAAGACRLWSLTPMRFGELANRNPALALEIAMALGSVVSRRLANRPRRIAVT